MASILMLTPQVPYPPRQGTALRNWGLLRGLAAHHRVSLLSFAAPDQAEAVPPTLARHLERSALVGQPARTLQQRLHDLLLTRQPDLVQRLYTDTFANRLASWLRAHAFDWVLVEGLELAPYLAQVWALGERRPRVAFDDHNCEYLLQQRAARADARQPRRWVGAFYSAIQWRRLRRYEAQVCRRADLVVAVSEADATALRALVPGLAPLVVPNGIDVDAYARFETAAPLESPAFVFTGTMDFRPNVDGVLWFVDRVWPQVRAALPSAHCYLVGQRPHRRLERLRTIPGVVITGAVPDTRPFIRAATVYIAPLLVGGGSRLKLLESTAMGKAVVATRLAAEGFEEPQRAMVLADTPDDFAAACIQLAQEPALRRAWGERALAFAHAYDWQALVPPLSARLMADVMT